MAKPARDTLLGMVFFGGLGLLLWATTTLTNLSFEPAHRLVVQFNNAAGLQVGDPVYVLGHRNGQVTDIEWQPQSPDRPIHVGLELETQIQLRQEQKIEIRDSNLLGGKQINISPGRSGPPLTPEGPIFGSAHAGALDSLGDTDIVGAVDSIKAFFDHLNAPEGTLNAVESFFEMLLDPKGSIGPIVSQREAYDEMIATITSLRQSVEQVEKGDGILHQLIYDQQAGKDLVGALSEIRTLTASVNSGNGVISDLLNDGAMAKDLAAGIADLKEITASARNGKGLMAHLLNDETLADQLGETLTSLRSVAQKLDDPGAGLAGGLLADVSMLTDLRTTLGHIGEITGKINDPGSPGLLSKLINDPILGQQLDRLFSQVTGALEDAREAAPMGTFFQVLAGPF